MVELSTSTIILEYVCPSLGVIICQFMFSAPYTDLQRAVARGQIGDLNPTPWAFMLGNCFGWCAYGVLKNNLFIFFANAPGFLLSVHLNLGAVKLLYQRHHSTVMRKSLVDFLKEEESKHLTASSQRQLDTTTTRISEVSQLASPIKTNDWATVVWNVTSQTTPAPAPHETLVLVVVTIWTVCISVLGFAHSLDSQTQDFIVGTLVNLNLVFFYGAPLSTIYTVVKQGNSSSIHIRTMVTNTLNGCFWTAYGIAVLDPFIFVPNGLGALLGCIQIGCIGLYPRRPISAIDEAAKGRQGGDTQVPPETTLPLTANNSSAMHRVAMQDMDTGVSHRSNTSQRNMDTLEEQTPASVEEGAF